MLEVKVEKLTSSGPKRLITWVYHLAGVDIAVQYEILENAYDKLKGDVYASLKSFRPITRTKALTTETTGKKIKFRDESDMTLEERRDYRQEKEKYKRDRTVKSLPDDWEVIEMGRFLVLLHGDKKFAKRCVGQAEAMWKWLDKTFAFYGPEEYIPQPILRVCKDGPEERAFLDGTAWGSGEIVTHRDPNSGSGSWEFEYVNQRMVGIWFRSRNSDAWSAAPYWLRHGLDQVIGTARLKGSRIDFKVDSWERDGLREVARAGGLTPPQQLVMMKRSEFYENRKFMQQSAALIRFLLGSKSKKYRNVISDYLRGLQDSVAEKKAAADKDKGKRSTGDAPKTEKEEEERAKKRSEDLKEKEDEFIKDVYERTFGKWTEKDWKKLKDVFFKSMG